MSDRYDAYEKIDLNEENTCELLGCDDFLIYEDDDTKQYECRRCGAEWWEDKD